MFLCDDVLSLVLSYMDTWVLVRLFREETPSSRLARLIGKDKTPRYLGKVSQRCEEDVAFGIRMQWEEGLDEGIQGSYATSWDFPRKVLSAQLSGTACAVTFKQRRLLTTFIIHCPSDTLLLHPLTEKDTGKLCWPWYLQQGYGQDGYHFSLWHIPSKAVVHEWPRGYLMLLKETRLWLYWENETHEYSLGEKEPWVQEEQVSIDDKYYSGLFFEDYPLNHPHIADPLPNDNEVYGFVCPSSSREPCWVNVGVGNRLVLSIGDSVWYRKGFVSMRTHPVFPYCCVLHQPKRRGPYWMSVVDIDPAIPFKEKKVLSYLVEEDEGIRRKLNHNKFEWGWTPWSMTFYSMEILFHPVRVRQRTTLKIFDTKGGRALLRSREESARLLYVDFVPPKR